MRVVLEIEQCRQMQRPNKEFGRHGRSEAATTPQQQNREPPPLLAVHDARAGLSPFGWPTQSYTVHDVSIAQRSLLPAVPDSPKRSVLQEMKGKERKNSNAIVGYERHQHRLFKQNCLIQIRLSNA
mmetsp:Transcript_13351/g.27678  ORF Transcript_13351/g.27678 Transcript_13351/m.27678 type:complete len:126 (-) Transcript_13351:246-623(-)